MLDPFMHEGTEFYKYLLLITESITSMLQNLKSSTDLVSITNPQLQSSNKDSKNVTYIQDIKEQKKQSNYTLLDLILRKDFWFTEKESIIDINVLANVVAYTIQVLSFYLSIIYYKK